MKIPRGRFLSDYEKGKINAFIYYGKNKFQIANLIDRSDTIIQNYLNNKKKYGKNAKGGRQKALYIRDQNNIVHLSINRTVSWNKIKTELNLSASESLILI